MAVGQGLLGSSFDVVALSAAQGVLERLAQDRAGAHAARLRAVLQLHAALAAGGAGFGTSAHVALVEQVSEQAAQALLAQARLLSGLPGGVEAVECGLLGVEQAGVLTRRLEGAEPVVRIVVWARLRERLLSGHDRGVVLPPAELGRLLSGWLIVEGPRAAVDRRPPSGGGGGRAGGVPAARGRAGRARGQSGQCAGGAVPGPGPLSVLGGADDRSADERRLDALVDLLLGRDRLPLDDEQDPFAQPDRPSCPGAGDAAGTGSCGCRLQSAVPCGVGVSLLVPVGAALGTTDELAVLAGHGPVEPDLLAAVLAGAPVIRPVWVDPDGTPVAVGARTVSLPRGDPAGLRRALLELAASRPPRPAVPRHPDDHPRPPSVSSAAAAAVTVSADEPVLSGHRHPVGEPGPYRVPMALRRLLQVRAPRCEWPGCAHRSVRCDLDHDRAWPAGPTCGCGLGPCCRRHHRLKQVLLHKQRTAGGVVWTSPTGRAWLSPRQHQPPQPALRTLEPVIAPDPDDQDAQPEDLLLDDPGAELDPDHDDRQVPDDPHDEQDDDSDADAGNPYERTSSSPWGLPLDDPTRWT